MTAEQALKAGVHMEILENIKKTSPMDVIAHVRKNHAMEHATIHLLTELVPNISFSGYSLVKGFWILGKAELQDVQKAAEMAYARLNNGEKNLAVHPNCGTNIAVIGLCTAAAAMLTTIGDSDDKSPLSRFSALSAAGVIGAMAGKPLGPKVQAKITTDADVRNLSIVSINCSSVRGTPLFFIETAIS